MTRPNGAATGLTDILSCRVPIVLAGMGGVSRSDLVAAVSDAGGFGILGMVREPAMVIEREVEALRRRGCRNFGVNIIPAATDGLLLEWQIHTIIELDVPVISLFWDIEPGIVARFRDAGITVIYQVGSVDEAIAAERAGAHIIVAQGVEAGGHVRGTRPLRTLLPDIVEAVGVPVLAAGGLGSGSDLVAAMTLGAGGIMLGTAMLATTESFAHDFHKQRLLEARSTDTLLTNSFHINWPPGAPVRVLKSHTTELRPPIHASVHTVIGDEEGRPIYLFSTDSPLRSTTGDFAAMALYAGTGVGGIDRIVPARERIDRIVAEARDLLAAAHPDPLIESSSAVCYIDEFAGNYMGTLDGSELEVELRWLGAALQSLVALRSTAFSPDSLPVAACGPWVILLEERIGNRPRATAPASPEVILDRLSRLIPRMSEGALRQSLQNLRSVLETRYAAGQPALVTA